MCFLKSRKQLNNRIIWPAKYRKTLLGFFQGIKAHFHVTLWEMTIAWAAVTGKSFHSVAWTPYTFCPALWNSSSCRYPFLFYLLQEQGIHEKGLRTLEALQHHMAPPVCLDHERIWFFWRSCILHRSNVTDTSAKTGSQDPCQCWLTGIKNHMGSTPHTGAPKSSPVEMNCSGLSPAGNLRLIQTWHSSEIFLNLHPVYCKGSCHSLKYKHGPLLLFNHLLPHLGARHTLRV